MHDGQTSHHLPDGSYIVLTEVDEDGEPYIEFEVTRVDGSMTRTTSLTYVQRELLDIYCDHHRKTTFLYRLRSLLRL